MAARPDAPAEPLVTTHATDGVVRLTLNRCTRYNPLSM